MAYRAAGATSARSSAARNQHTNAAHGTPTRTAATPPPPRQTRTGDVRMATACHSARTRTSGLCLRRRARRRPSPRTCPTSQPPLPQPRLLVRQQRIIAAVLLRLVVVPLLPPRGMGVTAPRRRTRPRRSSSGMPSWHRIISGAAPPPQRLATPLRAPPKTRAQRTAPSARLFTCTAGHRSCTRRISATPHSRCRRRHVHLPPRRATRPRQGRPPRPISPPPHQPIRPIRRQFISSGTTCRLRCCARRTVRRRPHGRRVAAVAAAVVPHEPAAAMKRGHLPLLPRLRIRVRTRVHPLLGRGPHRLLRPLRGSNNRRRAAAARTRLSPALLNAS